MIRIFSRMGFVNGLGLNNSSLALAVVGADRAVTTPIEAIMVVNAFRRGTISVDGSDDDDGVSTFTFVPNPNPVLVHGNNMIMCMRLQCIFMMIQ